MENLKISSDALFILLGAIMVLAMHAGFAFLELGTVRKKNQVNTLVFPRSPIFSLDTRSLTACTSSRRRRVLPPTADINS